MTKIEISKDLACQILMTMRDSGVGKESLVTYLGVLEKGLKAIEEKYEPVDCLYRVISRVVTDERLLEWWLLYSERQTEYYPFSCQTPVIIKSAEDLLDYHFSEKE